MSSGSRADSAIRVMPLTPVGQGAIACLRLVGPGADKLIAARFTPVGWKPYGERPLGRLQFGRWLLPEGERYEEVVVNRLAIDVVEVACHGGVAITAAILEDLLNSGAVRLEGPTPAFDAASSPFGALDALSEAAHAALAEARTSAAAAVLLDQYSGALRQAIDAILADIAAGRLDEALAKTDAVLRHAPLGLHLVRPWRVAVVGRPNVGKSRLMNALLGYDRAIVHAAPGTTRDVVSAATAFGGWPVELSDTAGVRETSDEIESAGVALSLSQLAAADLAIVVWDGSRPVGDEDRRPLAARPDALLVVNKSDLPAAVDPTPNALRISAATGDGISALADEIGRRLVPNMPFANEAVPFTPQQVTALKATRAALAMGDATLAAQSLTSLLSRRISSVPTL